MRFVRVGGIFQPYIRAYDGLNTGGACGLIELDRAKKIRQIGNGHGWHIKTGGGFGQIVDTHNTVRQGKLAMYA